MSFTVTSKPGTLHFQIRTSVPRGGSMAAAWRSAALAAALTELEPRLRVSVVVAAGPDVHDRLYTRVRELIALPEGSSTDAHGMSAGVPDLVIVDEAQPAASIAAALATGCSVVERVDGRVPGKDGSPVAWRMHQPVKPVVEVTGEREMLLDPALLAFHARRRPVARPPRELLILVGAGQHPVAELRLAEELAPLAANYERIDFVTGFNSTAAQRRELAALLPTARIIPGLTQVAPLLARADLAILSGATLAREAAMLGTPALLVSCRETDMALDAKFAVHGSAVHLGHHEALYPGLLARTLKKLTAERLLAMAAAGPELCPGDALPRLLQRARQLQLQRPAKAPSQRSLELSAQER